MPVEMVDSLFQPLWMETVSSNPAVCFSRVSAQANKNLDMSINASNNFDLNITWSLSSTGSSVSTLSQGFGRPGMDICKWIRAYRHDKYSNIHQPRQHKYYLEYS